MNTALLEELLRRKAQLLHNQGLTVAEAIDLAGDEILSCASAGDGHGSRFCLRMVLNGAKRRISPEICTSAVSEVDKRYELNMCVGMC
ncbi:hypothetical protein [Maridesulfovibrio sp.]|uniref:hypothetical protein n=1 Tax=Maridesulfovibrio sp. TaxID=2795000 RepID=UPI0039F03880